MELFEGLIFLFLFATVVNSCDQVNEQYDIRKYYDKPYCEKAKVGNTEIEKCYKVIEVTK